MTASAPRPAERAASLACLLLLGLPLLSAFLNPAATVAARVVAAAFIVLAAAAPPAAILVTLGLAGFGGTLASLLGVPTLRVTELMAIATVAGFCARAAVGRAPAAVVPAAALLLGATVAASAAVWLHVQQVQTDYPGAFLRALLRSVTADYLVEPGEFWALVPPLVILQGLGLLVAVLTLARADETLMPRGVRMLAAGGAGLALMSVFRVAEIYLRNPGAIAAMRATPTGLRISPQIPDYIAAGSYFALCWLGALGLALAVQRRWRAAWLAASLPVLGALYLTGSRSVIGAAVAGATVMAVLLLRVRTVAVTCLAVAAAAVMVLMVAAYPWLTGRDFAGRLAGQSLQVRGELFRAGAGMIRSHPVFGVGVDRFYLIAEANASPRLKALFPARKNPHNDFLRMAAELGLVGFGLFVWLLATVGRRLMTGMARAGGPALASLGGGLAAFLVTSLFSNPLMVREVSYVFWIVAGLAAAAGYRDTPGALTRTAAAAGRRRRLLPAIAPALVIVATVPFRARQETARLDMTQVTYGLYEWVEDPVIGRSRSTRDRATVFVPASARHVFIPIKGTLPSAAPQQIDVLVNHRLADRFEVRDDWRHVQVQLPADAVTRPHRIDLVVAPTWVPARTLASSSDERVLGVQVGAVDLRNSGRR